MTPELWGRLKPFFDAAVDLPAEERKAFVAQIGGDDDLRLELNNLIAGFEASELAGGSLAERIRTIIPPAIAPLEPGHELGGRYRIVRWIGSGGMGDVYEGIDLELSEPIALKVISPSIADSPGVLARFRKEVQLAHRLTGPNVCRIHGLVVLSESEAETTRAFLTMELLEGKTLAEEIRERGPLPWAEASDITLDLCTALQSMHEAGIIHRDLKTRNVMLAFRHGARRAVLMDFGLAREIERPAGAADTGLSVPGMVIGTPECMSPEQFSGGQLTAATDIYSMGVVLYEMLTSREPFPAGDPISAAILRARTPQAVSTIRKDLPSRCDAIIAKCLKLDPAERYASASELATATRGRQLLKRTGRWLAAAVLTLVLALILILTSKPALRERLQGLLFASSEKHIAVLPFEVEGSDPRTQALSIGLMDSMSERLASFDTVNHAMWVVPAREIRAQKVVTASQAWRAFGVTMVVSGRLERSGNTIHITLDLIDSRKLRQIGSTDLKAQDEDLESMENEAVAQVARMFGFRSVQPQTTPERPDPSTFVSYLTALGDIQRYDKAGNLDAAIGNLNSVIAKDPGFVLAYVHLAEAYRMKYQLDRNPHWLDVALDRCRRAPSGNGLPASFYITLARIHQSMGQSELVLEELNRALSIDPRNSDAITALADAYGSEGKMEEAESLYKKAIDLRPDYWDGYQALANFYSNNGRPAEAIPIYLHAVQLTPDNSDLYSNLGITYLSTGDPRLLPAAETALKKSIDLNPQYAAYSNLSYLYLVEKRYSEAAEAAEKGVQLGRDDYRAWAALASAYQWVGKEDKAAEARDRMLPLLRDALKLNPKNAKAHAAFAGVLVHQGKKDDARQEIQTALAWGSSDSDVLSDVGSAYELLLDRKNAIKYTRLALSSGATTQDLGTDPDLQSLLRDPHFGLSVPH